MGIIGGDIRCGSERWPCWSIVASVIGTPVENMKGPKRREQPLPYCEFRLLDDLHNKGWFSCNSPGVCQDVGSETGRKPPHDASLWIPEYVSSSLLCDDRAGGRPVRCLDRGRFAEVPGSGAKTFDATRTPTGDWGWASV